MINLKKNSDSVSNKILISKPKILLIIFGIRGCYLFLYLNFFYKRIFAAHPLKNDRIW